MWQVRSCPELQSCPSNHTGSLSGSHTSCPKQNPLRSPASLLLSQILYLGEGDHHPCILLPQPLTLMLLLPGAPNPAKQSPSPVPLPPLLPCPRSAPTLPSMSLLPPAVASLSQISLYPSRPILYTAPSATFQGDLSHLCLQPLDGTPHPQDSPATSAGASCHPTPTASVPRCSARRQAGTV